METYDQKRYCSLYCYHNSEGRCDCRGCTAVRTYSTPCDCNTEWTECELCEKPVLQDWSVPLVYCEACTRANAR